ncbi:MAG: hypothetical protein HRU20_01540 [Pseudomonadales bacterium]|nr:hypothetical protein [Pseudomonadales bacterium]
MKHIFSTIAFCITMLCGSASSHASDFFEQFIDPNDGYLDASSWLLDNAYGFLPVPIIISEPAIGYGAGMAAVFFHESEEQKNNRIKRQSGESSAPPSLPTRLSFVGAMATDNGTKGWVGGHFGAYGDDRYRYTGAGGQFDVNMAFYDANDRAWDLNLSASMLYQDLKVRLADSRFFAGLKFILLDTDVKLENANIDLPDFVTQFFDTRSTGLGITLMHDSRETLWGAEKGNLTELQSVEYSSLLGGDHDFTSYKFYSHQYFVMAANLFGGVRFDYRTVSGDVPFYQKPYIDLMGIPSMRYQGEHTAVAEMNLRWMPHPRWSLIGFAGVGRAADEFNELDKAPSRTTQGLGFRYLMANKMRLHSGVDVAWGDEEPAVYFKTGIGW